MSHTIQYKKPEFDILCCKKNIQDKNVSLKKKHPVLLADHIKTQTTRFKSSCMRKDEINSST